MPRVSGSFRRDASRLRIVETRGIASPRNLVETRSRSVSASSKRDREAFPHRRDAMPRVSSKPRRNAIQRREASRLYRHQSVSSKQRRDTETRSIASLQASSYILIEAHNNED